MDVHAARGGERTLRRVIALLVAFAVLAERATGRSLPIRWFLLWILRRAETAAAVFVFDRTGLPAPVLEGGAAAGNDAADAPRFAERFRALAAMLRALLPVAWPFKRRPALRGFAFGHAARGSARGPGGWTPRPYDTS